MSTFVPFNSPCDIVDQTIYNNRKFPTYRTVEVVGVRNLKVDSIVVAVGHDQFKRISAKKLRTLCRSKNPVIGDLKSIYSKEKLKEEGFSVIRL